MVFATFMFITEKKTEELEQVPGIWYPVIFKDKIEALLDLKNEINKIG